MHRDTRDASSFSKAFGHIKYVNIPGFDRSMEKPVQKIFFKIGIIHQCGISFMTFIIIAFLYIA